MLPIHKLDVFGLWLLVALDNLNAFFLQKGPQPVLLCVWLAEKVNAKLWHSHNLDVADQRPFSPQAACYLDPLAVRFQSTHDAMGDRYHFAVRPFATLAHAASCFGLSL